MKTNAAPHGIELVIGKADKVELDDTYFGAMVQYPNQHGAIHDYTEFVKKAKAHNIFVGVATDLLALTLLTPPGEWGADCVMGSTHLSLSQWGSADLCSHTYHCRSEEVSILIHTWVRRTAKS